MNTIYRSNLKRIQGILLTDENETFDSIIGNQDSDSNNGCDYLTSESDDTYADEHISEESNSSDSDIDQSGAAANTQPQTLEKAGVLWSMNSNPVKGRISAAGIMKQKPGSRTNVQTIVDAFKLFFTNEILDEILHYTNLYAARCFWSK